MTYRLHPTDAQRVAYHGALPFTAPLACDVRDAAGATHRAAYVAGSMLEHGGARYVVEGAVCQLGRDGVLRPAVASEARRAA